MVNDPRLPVVENVIAWHAARGPRACATEVLKALDELRVHDQRGNMGWDDETEPDGD